MHQAVVGSAVFEPQRVTHFMYGNFTKPDHFVVLAAKFAIASKGREYRYFAVNARKS
jgi:carbonic anhydrase